MVIRLADEYGIQLFDIRKPFLDLGDYSDYICADGMHPNAAGHKLIANFLRKESGFMSCIPFPKIKPSWDVN